MSYTVFADMRFFPTSGIGKVQQALLSHKPADFDIIDLKVSGKYGHPLSFLRLTRTLLDKPRGGSVFWSAGFVPPAYSAIPSIVTVHDLTHLHYYDKKRRSYYNYVFKPLYHRCAAIICVSEYTKSEFVKWSGVSADKVHVIYNSVDPAYLLNRQSKDLGYRYILYAGNHRPYKNIATLIRAYAQSDLIGESIHLAITGHDDDDLKDVVAATNTGPYVHFLGHVDESDMPALYRGAEILTYISLYEGFGLPILEAMASEVPVITSNVSSMPEVAEGAAVIVDPLSIPAVAGALNQLIHDADLRSTTVRRGTERVKAFSWEKSSAKFWALLQHCAL